MNPSPGWRHRCVLDEPARTCRARAPSAAAEQNSRHPCLAALLALKRLSTRADSGQRPPVAQLLEKDKAVRGGRALYLTVRAPRARPPAPQPRAPCRAPAAAPGRDLAQPDR